MIGRRALLGLSLACAIGCREPPPPAPAVVELDAKRIAVPAPHDVGEECHDVGSVRACWVAGGPTLVPRPLPASADPTRFRCTGIGAERHCRDRATLAPPFSCAGDTCTQPLPRRPDDGEWQCSDLSGATLCRELAKPAGIVPGPADPGWICGTRAGKKQERLCLDLSPDRPARPVNESCRYDEERVPAARVCVPGTQRNVGDPCPDGRCPDGSECSGGHCLPERAAIDCWASDDCGPGQRCALGFCRGGS